MTITEEQHKALRAPFPDAAVGKLPKLTCKQCSNRSCSEHKKTKCRVCDNYISTAHIDLDYVGHAEVTDRLLSVDPEWTWEPVAYGPDGGPLVRRQGNEATLWIRLTVCGITRPGVGSVAASAYDAEKQLVGDALRNAAMRFGVALDLWSKNELESALEDTAPPPGVDPTTGEITTIRRPPPSRELDASVERPPATVDGDCATCGKVLDATAVKSAGKRHHRACLISPVPEHSGPPLEPGAGPGGEPRESAAPGSPPTSLITDGQVRNVHRLLRKLNVGEDDKHRYCSHLIGIDVVESLNDLTKRQASTLIDALMAEAGEA